MSLPELPRRDGRDLLQAIWDLTTEQGRWPTFAEVDRRFYYQHDTQALEAIRALPPGFLSGAGAGTSIHMPPLEESQPIALTVAGIANCYMTRRFLEVYVEFVWRAAELERCWHPPTENPETPASMTSCDAASLLRTRILPTAEQDQILTLLPFVLGVEAHPWATVTRNSTDAKAPAWTVSLNRQVRRFRGVSSIEGYWDRRYKHWESTVAAASPVATEDRSEFLNASPEVLADVLLQAILKNSRSLIHVPGRPMKLAPIDCPEVAPNLDLGTVDAVLNYFESEGLVSIIPVASGVSLVALEPGGRRQAVSNRDFRRDPVRWAQCARLQLLRWHYNQNSYQHRSLPRVDGSYYDHTSNCDCKMRFWHDPLSVAHGHFLTPEDTQSAEQYLIEKHWLSALTYDPFGAPGCVRITAAGIDLIERGDTVDDSPAKPADGGRSYSIESVIATNAIFGDHATQHVTTSGQDVSALVTALHGLIEGLSALRLDERDRQEATIAAELVIAEVQQSLRDESRVRKSLETIRQALAKVGNQALSTILTAAVDTELKRLGLLPGGESSRSENHDCYLYVI